MYKHIQADLNLHPRESLFRAAAPAALIPVARVQAVHVVHRRHAHAWEAPHDILRQTHGHTALGPIQQQRHGAVVRTDGLQRLAFTWHVAVYLHDIIAYVTVTST